MRFRQGTEFQTLQVVDVDPTLSPGISGGTSNLLLLRTDTNQLYYYAGPLDTDWRIIIGGFVPPVINEFDSSTNPNTATVDVEILYLYSGTEVALQPGIFNGQRVQVVLMESPAATVVVTTGASIPTFKTSGDGLIPHYSLVLYWSNTLGEWVPTDTMQWDF